MTRNRLLPGWALFSVVLLPWLSVGCAQSGMSIHPGPRINSAGLPPGETGGRLLEMAVVCLTEDHFNKLNRTESFRRLMGPDVEDPWSEITARKWYLEGIEAVVKRVVTEDDAFETVLVRHGEPLEVKIKHPAPGGKRAGILVVANFNGLEDERRTDIEATLWAPTGSGVLRGLFSRGRLVVEVGETWIRWAQKD